MDAVTFDRWTRALSRRAFAGAVGLLTVASSGLASARKKRRHKNRHKKKKIKRNAFGCVDVGKFCKNGDQCCSGICEGRKGKGACKAHDTGGCLAGQQEEQCGGDITVTCTLPSGDGGACNTTTGNAGYCRDGAQCFACQKDADCQQFCGAAAACVRCDPFCSEQGGTACVGQIACQGLPD